MMPEKDAKVCSECEGQGWVHDWLGACGDPECCGGPYQVQCRACGNDWNPTGTLPEPPK